jgi:hypothetical protein
MESHKKNSLKLKTVHVKRVFKYKESFLDHGFTKIVVDNQDRPKCVICKAVLSNSSLTNTFLLRHKKLHPVYFNEKRDYFRTLLAKEQDEDEPFADEDDSAIINQISYEISYEIAKQGYSHCTGEKLVKKCLSLTAGKFGVQDLVQKIKKIPLSRKTIKRRIDEMANNIEEKLLNQVKESPAFSIQIDESTDTGDIAELMAYVRFINDGNVKEDFLFCKAVGVSTTGEDIFR